MSSSNCCFLTCIQISQEAGKAVWYSHLFQNFHSFFVIYTVKGFSIVNEIEVDIFSGILLLFLWSNGCWQFDLWFLCLFETKKISNLQWKLLGFEYEFKQTQGNSEGQRILACCSSWGHKESRHDLATEQQHKSECTIRHPKTGIDAVGYIKPELRIPISKRYLKALKWGSKYTLPPRR